MKITGTTKEPKQKRRGVQGKIARKKQKDNALANTLKVHVKKIAESTQIGKPASEGASPVASQDKLNIFAGLNINISGLTKSLADQCVPITKDSIPKHFPKKEKRKLRHEAFLKKIESVPEVRRSDRKKRKQLKKSSDVVMEAQVPIAVPDTTPEPVDKKGPVKRKNTKEPLDLSAKPIPKKKKREEQHLRDIQLFKEVMSNSVYQSNPGAAITNYIRNKVCGSIQSES